MSPNKNKTTNCSHLQNKRQTTIYICKISLLFFCILKITETNHHSVFRL